MKGEGTAADHSLFCFFQSWFSLSSPADLWNYVSPSAEAPDSFQFKVRRFGLFYLDKNVLLCAPQASGHRKVIHPLQDCEIYCGKRLHVSRFLAEVPLAEETRVF